MPEYDVITFFDVLEHMVNPESALAWAVGRLAAGGRIVASIPNSAHVSFRIKMLRGDWTMADAGLFDRTHVRFYDLKTMTKLCPPGTHEVGRRFYAPGRAWKRGFPRLWPSLLAFHVVIVWQRN